MNDSAIAVVRMGIHRDQKFGESVNCNYTTSPLPSGICHLFITVQLTIADGTTVGQVNRL